MQAGEADGQTPGKNNVRMDVAITGGDFCRLHPAEACMSDEAETIARYPRAY
jgi:hypothetical protein